MASFFGTFKSRGTLSVTKARAKSWLLLEVLWHIRTCTSCALPMHPQLDGLVEHYVKAVREHPTKVIQWITDTGTRGCPSSWWPMEYQPMLLQYVHCTAWMPIIMAFLREFYLPCDLLFGALPDTEYPKTDYMKGPVKQLQDIHYYAVQCREKQKWNSAWRGWWVSSWQEERKWKKGQCSGITMK